MFLLLKGLKNKNFYFINSYYCDLANNSMISSVVRYEGYTCSSLSNKNIYGIQFHPEKSQQEGLNILKIFLFINVKRLITSLIIDEKVVVQSINFELTNIIHTDPAIAIEYFNKWSVDEIIILNVSEKNLQKRKIFKNIEKYLKEIFLPITAGGWIK